MDDLPNQQTGAPIRPPQQPPPPPPVTEQEVKPKTPEQIVAESVSEKLLSSALETSHKLEEELSPDRDTVGHSFGEPIIEEPFHQNVEFQSEHRFSGHPIQQYIYDEEEEDEEYDNEIDIDLSDDQRNESSRENLFIESNTRPEADDLLNIASNESKDTKEEILYHLSDDNVLTAQSYGYGTDLRIDSDHKAQDLSVYELDSEDPFGTPHKQIPRPDSAERDFERFVDKCEPFETITDDIEDKDEPMRASVNLLDLDQSIAPTLSSQPLSAAFGVSEETAVKESHSMVETMPDSLPEPNHALSAVGGAVGSDKSPDLLPSSVVDTDVAESQLHSDPEPTNKRDTELSPNVSPNLDTFESTLEPSYILEQTNQQVLPSQPETDSPPPLPEAVESIAESEEVEQDQFEESPIGSFIETETLVPTQLPIEPEPEDVVTPRTMSSPNESEQAVTTSSSSGQCPFSPSAWFNPKQLNPTVAELVYWRDPKKSGIVFGAGLVILLSLTFFSIISVIAYTSLAILSGTLSFRIYKNILQAVQKTNEGHPFKEYLEVEITPSSERIHEIIDSVLSHMNCTINKLRSVFLVEDIVDSLKFAVLFWCLTYIGSWFNGLTLVILAYLGLFSLPKIYEMNKTQVDQYLGLASAQICDITSKIRAKIPFPAKKDKEN